MTALLRPWWDDRSGRERWLVGVAGALLLGVALWLGAWRPLAAARAAATARQAAAVGALAEVAEMTAAIRAAEARLRGAPGVPLVERISARASAAGIASERLETTSDGLVTLRIPAVRAAPLLGWLAELERRDGVIVERVNLVRNPDATIAAELAVRDGGRG